MPRKKFALDEGGPQRVQIEWKHVWKDITICIDGLELARLPGKTELNNGRTVTLDDGTKVKVALTKGLFPELEVSRDGYPLPGSPTDPRTRIKTAVGVALFVAGVNFLLGLLGILTGSSLLEATGGGYELLFFGAMFVGLALWIKRASRAALILASGLIGLDGLVSIIDGIAAGGGASIGGVIVPALLIFLLVRAIPAAKVLQENAARLVTTSTAARN